MTAKLRWLLSVCLLSKKRSQVNKIAQSKTVRDSWNDAYVRHGLTNWELLPLRDMAEFASKSGVPFSDVRTIVSIGCGRGSRELNLLLLNSNLNRSEVSLCGIDLSSKAIQDAKRCEKSVRGGKGFAGPLRDAMSKCFNGSSVPPLLASIEYECAEFLSWNSTKSFDLVIDWMCLHALHPALRAEYIGKILSFLPKYIILKVFSSDISTVQSPKEAVPGVPKSLFSRAEVEAMFHPDYEVLHVAEDAEDLNPANRPTDDIVTGKRAFLFGRIPDGNKVAQK